MAVMGLRLAQRANGVSKLHGEVSRGDVRRAVAGLRHRRGADHLGHQRRARPDLGRAARSSSWRSARSAASSTEAARGWEAIDAVPERRDLGASRRDAARAAGRRGPHAAARVLAAARAPSSAELGWIDDVLDPDVLTIGFARRVPSYKRLTLMLRDPERLKDAAAPPERPIQIVVAGKAHPADDGGKRLIQELVRFTDDPEVRHRIVFLPDYDIAMAQPLYPGCDVWLNNPLRPLEACGTSGMKAALNGCLNLSVLDGWWDEMVRRRQRLGDPDRRRRRRPGPPRRPRGGGALRPDRARGRAAFYDRDADGLPHRWIEMVRHTLRTLGPKVLASRMVRDYVERALHPGRRCRSRAVDGPATRRPRARRLEGPGARGLAGGAGRPRRVQRRRAEPVQLGQSLLPCGSTSSLGELTPDDVEVQLRLRRGRRRGPARVTDHGRAGRRPRQQPAATLPLRRRRVPLDRTGSFGYTVRVLPEHPLLANSAEMNLRGRARRRRAQRRTSPSCAAVRLAR